MFPVVVLINTHEIKAEEQQGQHLLLLILQDFDREVLVSSFPSPLINQPAPSSPSPQHASYAFSHNFIPLPLAS